MSQVEERKLQIFHLAIPVKDISSTLEFYREKLKLAIDLIEERRCIVNFFGHQVVAHISEKEVPQTVSMYPRHFGIIFDRESNFETLLKNAKASGVKFFHEEMTRFPINANTETFLR